MALPVGEFRRVGRRDAGDLEDRVAFAGGRRLRRIALLRLEGFGEQRRAVGKSGNDALRGHRRRGDQLQMVCGCRLIEAVLHGLRSQRLRIALLRGRGLLANQCGLDGRQHLAQRLRVRLLALFDLNDVVAILGLDDFCIADFLSEDGVVELGHHAPALRESQLAAGILAAGVIGIFLGQIGKVGAALNLFEDQLGFGLGGRIGFGVGSLIDLDQDMARTGLFRHGVFRLVGGVVLLDFLLRGLRYAARHVVRGEGEVGDAALLRERLWHSAPHSS